MESEPGLRATSGSPASLPPSVRKQFSIASELTVLLVVRANHVALAFAIARGFCSRSWVGFLTAFMLAAKCRWSKIRMAWMA